MKNLWNTISLIGSKKLKSPEDLRELSLLNRIIFIAVINLTSFIPIIIYFQQYPSVIAISIGILLCLLVLYMNHIGYFGFARTAFLFIAVLFVSGILVFMSGAHAGSQVVFVMLTTLHLVLFRRPKYIFMVFLLIMAVLGIVSYWAENHTALLDNADPFIRVFSFYMNVVSCSVLVFAIVLYFRNTTYEHEKTIVEQNQKILEKNKDITDSINYARRLQNAILPPVNAFKHHFSDSFVLYLPKDIVAGDFYWLEEVENDNGKMVFVAAADCTGHGVPGAIVSVVCNNALNRSLREFKLHEPGELLDRTRQLVISEFEKSDDEVKDGMDISLAVFHFPKNKDKIQVKWSGANNGLWHVRNKMLTEIKPDKQPVGKYAKANAFTTNTIDVQKGDTLYLFTDGYADQFGGPQGKKFKASAMKELIVSVQALNMKMQAKEIATVYHDWKAEMEQIDDVCMIGIKM